MESGGVFVCFPTLLHTRAASHCLGHLALTPPTHSTQLTISLWHKRHLGHPKGERMLTSPVSMWFPVQEDVEDRLSLQKFQDIPGVQDGLEKCQCCYRRQAVFGQVSAVTVKPFFMPSFTIHLQYDGGSIFPILGRTSNYAHHIRMPRCHPCRIARIRYMSYAHPC